MSNILNHNRTLIDFIMTGEDYWDFHLASEMGYGGGLEGLTEECLSAYIDFNDPDCVFWDDAFSKASYVWENAVNEGVLLEYIGTSGIDNGFITYEKDRITNKEFLDIFFNSTYYTDNNDLRLHLRKVDGNNQIYDYSNNIVHIDDRDAAELRGGFYQGFYKLHEQPYQVLPYELENGWNMEVKLKKSGLKNEKLTINDTHPENKGIFLYIGTRAENKWWKKYLVDQDFDPSPNGYQNNEYVETDYTTEDEDVNSSYIQEDDKQEAEYLEQVYENDGEHCKTVKCEYIDKNYVDDEYYKTGAHNCNQYVDDEYLETEEEITGDEAILTKEGFDFSQPNIIRYDTDNKHIFFNRTDEGFTTKTWDESTEKITLFDIKKPDIGNYFQLFNRTENGYTIKTIDELIDIENKRYDVMKDIYRNALAFQIKDDGSIGFKYLVKDCESEDFNNYKIEELFSAAGVIKDDEWYTINVKIVPTRVHTIKNPLCDHMTTSAEDKMVIYIYVNGKLVLKSAQLPILNLRALDDLSEKQQGVPFSLSLGGGTQGLCDVVYLDYRELPKYMLPLEKEFCGSFVGYIQTFRFYACPMNFTQIQENYRYDMLF